MVETQWNGKTVTIHISRSLFILLTYTLYSLFSLLSPDRTDVGYSVSSASAAGVLPHAAGMALRFHSLAGTF